MQESNELSFNNLSSDLGLSKLATTSLEGVVDWLLNLKSELKHVLDDKKWYQKFSIRGSATKKLYEYLDKDRLFSDTSDLMNQFKGAKGKELEENQKLNTEEMEEILIEKSKNVTTVLPVFKGMLAGRLSLIISSIDNIAKSAPKGSYLHSSGFQNSLAKAQTAISEKCELYKARQQALIKMLTQNNLSDKGKLLKLFTESKKAMNKNVKDMVKAAKEVEESLEDSIMQQDN